MDAEQLRDFGERYTAAWCSQDPARVAAFFSTSGSLTINGGAPAEGREAIREVVQGFMTAFPDLVLTMDKISGQGDRAFVPLDVRGHEHRARRLRSARTVQRVREVGDWFGRADRELAGTL